MKKMKMTCESRDRLSELPDSLILNIFEFLPMNDVVRTQILSHRWETLWTVTPYLHFDNKFLDLDDFRNSVNRFLICWRGKRIQKFKVSGPLLSKSLFKDLYSWVRFAVDNGVQELIISFSQGNFRPDTDEYRPPKCLFSCSSLQKLSIFVSIMEINVNNGNGMRWNQLKSLEIHCFRITQHAIDLILSRSPVLEVFRLSFADKDNNMKLSFRSSSLKMLYVHKTRKNADMETELRICTPNLETLTINGASYGKCLLMDVSSLTHANLMFNKIDHLGATLSQILRALRHVEGLTFSDCCLQVLGAMTGCSILSPFPNVTFLSLNIGSFEEHEQIVGLLESFPKLQTLVVQEEATYHTKRKKPKFEPDLCKSFLEELRIVKVTWRRLDPCMFALIWTLLLHASKLEKMVFRVKRIALPSGLSDSMTSYAQTALLRMLEYSPNVKLIFCEF